MPEYMDVHRGMEGITPDGLMEAHRPISRFRQTRMWTSSTPGQTRKPASFGASRRHRARKPS